MYNLSILNVPNNLEKNIHSRETEIKFEKLIKIIYIL